jgi:hypothetical protein
MDRGNARFSGYFSGITSIGFSTQGIQTQLHNHALPIAATVENLMFILRFYLVFNSLDIFCNCQISK